MYGDEPVKCPVLDCKIAVDVVFRSDDHILFGAHRPNLEMYSEILKEEGFDVGSQKAHLIYGDASTVRLLLEGMHKFRRVTSLADLPSDRFWALADAAERYSVYTVMAACSEHISLRPLRHPDDALKCLVFAVKYGYVGVADSVASSTIHCDMSTVKKALRGYDSWFNLWVAYREKFIDLASEITTIPSGNHAHLEYVGPHNEICTRFETYCNALRLSLPTTLKESLRMLGHARFDQFQRIFDAHTSVLSGCLSGECEEKRRAWNKRCVRKLERIGALHSAGDQSENDSSTMEPW
ncbi:hypothetical protein DFP72DRAFT_924073 [Ephemerocybe angulata]|uniref:BTB domain-containing protein n=1 Tax=Ephemerocybe angulata TaxID=980116 RepID=A0A8H6LYK1_9AGAR|nr:hypothetical protein DFP72DRAFT_924073 [Tulosesus angulatus]